VLAAGAEQPERHRNDKKMIDLDLVQTVYARCNGYMQRVHEILTEESGIEIGYSTLTRIIRRNGIGQKTNKRCYQVPDMPGEEMQHDTSPHKLKIGGNTMPVICSGLYLRYSKMRYIRFYPNFNRFKMKSFLNEALTHWGYTAETCVIDNTNLAVLYGTGADAVFHPEMTAFAKRYGFEWLAHEKGHANRKAGTERNFWTVETNFFPGRTFENLEDLNRQAFEWATVRYAHRPLSKSRLIPISLFETEKPCLIKLPPYIEAPAQSHERNIDRYGYITFNANHYWTPGKAVGKISVIEYPDKIRIFPKDAEPLEYTLPAWGVKQFKFKPDGVNINPYGPNNIKKPYHEEEKRLRDMDEICREYLDFIKATESGIRQKPKYIRELYLISKKMAKPLFIATVTRALKYRVTNIAAMSRISRQLMNKELWVFPDIPDPGDYKNRQSYQEGRFSSEVEPEYYQNLLEQQNDRENENA